MSTYPGENTQQPEGQPPSGDAGAEPTAPYPQGGDPASHPASSETPPQPPQPSPGPAQPQNPYGQQAPYGAVAQPFAGPYSYPPGGVPGQPAYPAFAPEPAAHPQSTTALVLGLVGLIGSLFSCGLTFVVSPFAWAVGRNALKEIEASQGRLGGESQARAGMITGIVGTVLLVLEILVVIAVVILLVSSSTTSGSSV